MASLLFISQMKALESCDMRATTTRHFLQQFTATTSKDLIASAKSSGMLESYLESSLIKARKVIRRPRNNLTWRTE
jgi:hypothetical protein